MSEKKVQECKHGMSAEKMARMVKEVESLYADIKNIVLWMNEANQNFNYAKRTMLLYAIEDMEKIFWSLDGHYEFDNETEEKYWDLSKAFDDWSCWIGRGNMERSGYGIMCSVREIKEKARAFTASCHKMAGMINSD